MSYEMLEALIVTKIADVRKSEQAFERCMKAAKNGIRIDLDTPYTRLQAQLLEVEQLMQQLEQTPSYAPAASMPMTVTAPAAPLAWA